MRPAYLRWLVVAAFLGISQVNFPDRQLLAAAEPALKTEFGLSNAQYSGILSGFAIAHAIGAPLVGRLIDHASLNLGNAWAVGLWSMVRVCTAFSRTLGGLDSLPHMDAGKMDRFVSPEPQVMRADLKTPCVAPCGAVEEMVASIWAEVLGADQVGRLDNFIDLGGDSLGATKVILHLRKSLGAAVSDRLFPDANLHLALRAEASV